MSYLSLSLTSAKKTITEASYDITLCIAKHGKPFKDGEYLKAILKCGNHYKGVIINRINDIPAPARNIESRITELR